MEAYESLGGEATAFMQKEDDWRRKKSRFKKQARHTYQAVDDHGCVFHVHLG
jgi:hypothetical protein